MKDKMTVKEFLEAGHKFVVGDKIINITQEEITIEEITRITNEISELDGRRFVASAKALEKPRVKVEYEFIEDFSFSLKNEFEDGNLYCGGNDYSVITVEDDVAYHSQEDNLYRKVETEIKIEKRWIASFKFNGRIKNTEFSYQSINELKSAVNAPQGFDDWQFIEIEVEI